MTHAADRDAPDVISTGVYYDHHTGDGGEDSGHTTARGRVFGILPIRYTDCERYGCKPVVVLDPEEGDAIFPLLRQMRDTMFKAGDTYPGMNAFMGAMQAALRSLVAPPKPDEPRGLGAVVEVPSSRPGLGPKRLVRGHATKEPWMGDGRAWAWADIIGPVSVLSEGVTQ